MNKEQLTGTDATISCIVGGLTKELDEVKWTQSDNTDIKSGQDVYMIDFGTFSGDSQTTTLTVGADQNMVDETYECVVECIEHGKEAETTSVHLKALSKCILASGRDISGNHYNFLKLLVML